MLAGIRRIIGRGIAQWRRSLTLRVVATTVLASVAVVGVVGNVLVSVIARGLVSTRVDAVLAQATAAAAQAQRSFDAADPATTDSLAQLVDDVVARITQAGPPGEDAREVVLLRSPGQPPPGAALEVASNDVDPATVPADLRAKVASEPVEQWRHVLIRYRDGRTAPGVAVGTRIALPAAGTYELYQLFPLRAEVATLALIRRTMTFGAVALIVLVAVVAGVVVRQVLVPVRATARAAERLSAGRLTERLPVRGEDELARLATSFNEMASSLQRQISQLEDLSRMQQRFVSDVSHELRTPLTTVRMAADLLYERRGAYDEPTRRSVELLAAQLDRFESLLADLLEISRFDAGAAVLEAEENDLRAIVRRVVEGSRPLAARMGCEIRVSEPSTAVIAEVDSRRIERILRNLLVNALEHGRERPVEVAVAGRPDAVAVTVRDHGPGLAPDEAALVFNRFWRADPSRARTMGGSGLGLAIALEDARLHGGWLQVWGQPGVGSVFRLTVPRRPGGPLRDSPLPLRPADVPLALDPPPPAHPAPARDPAAASEQPTSSPPPAVGGGR